MTDTDRPEVDDPRVLALAQARQQMAHENQFNAGFCPPWDGLTEQEQRLSLLDARNYLRAALKAGLLAAPVVVPSAPADRAAILREAADALVAVAGQHPEARAVVIHWGDAAALLRTMAQEECDELEAQAHLDELADDLSRMADEAQQPEAPAVDRLARVREWVTSDVVTGRNEFGNGYREAQRDIRDLLNGRPAEPAVGAQQPKEA